MQRVASRYTSGYLARRAALRVRKAVSPQPPRPATTPLPVAYLLRVRTTATTQEQRDVWAAFVRQLRKATGVSRAEMARRLDVDPTTVWRWETGKQKPESAEICEAIAALFALDVNDVLTAASLRPGPAPESLPEPYDEELEEVRKAPGLTAETKMRIIEVILRRREEDRAASMAETRRIIELMRDTG